MANKTSGKITTTELSKELRANARHTEYELPHSSQTSCEFNDEPGVDVCKVASWFVSALNAGGGRKLPEYQLIYDNGDCIFGCPYDSASCPTHGSSASTEALVKLLRVVFKRVPRCKRCHLSCFNGFSRTAFAVSHYNSLLDDVPGVATQAASGKLTVSHKGFLEEVASAIADTECDITQWMDDHRDVCTEVKEGDDSAHSSFESDHGSDSDDD